MSYVPADVDGDVGTFDAGSINEIAIKGCVLVGRNVHKVPASHEGHILCASSRKLHLVDRAGALDAVQGHQATIVCHEKRKSERVVRVG